MRQERVSPPGFHRVAGTVAGSGLQEPLLPEWEWDEPLRLLL